MARKVNILEPITKDNKEEGSMTNNSMRKEHRLTVWVSNLA